MASERPGTSSCFDGLWLPDNNLPQLCAFVLAKTRPSANHSTNRSSPLTNWKNVRDTFDGPCEGRNAYERQCGSRKCTSVSRDSFAVPANSDVPCAPKPFPFGTGRAMGAFGDIR